jgi:saccharopine dehydrogenase (NAD+, L-lysine-forming)
MGDRIGVRREDMYHWERRVPLVPEDLLALGSEAGLQFRVQSSDGRAFSDDEYRAAGLEIVEALTDCPIIIGLKEIPVDALERDKVYVFFSHTIKGQPANMPMLQRCLDLGCTIIDYERIVDEDNRRLIFFGNYAGFAGAIDTLWTLGRRLAWEGIPNPLEEIAQASTYADLNEAKAAIVKVGERIASEGLPEEISPLILGVAGYGNVSKGAQEILDLLPLTEIRPTDLLEDPASLRGSNRGPILEAVFREEDTVLPLDDGKAFDLREYYDHPERYRAAFERYLPNLHALVNCIYWEPKYPRLVTAEAVRRLYARGQPTLRVIGDITCDVAGSIEITVKGTEPDDPVYVYDPETGTIRSGVEGVGPVMMAVEILPTELPREASSYFSAILKRFVPAIAAADYTVDFDALQLPRELKRAVICHRGELAPDYRTIEKYLIAADSA